MIVHVLKERAKSQFSIWSDTTEFHVLLLLYVLAKKMPVKCNGLKELLCGTQLFNWCLLVREQKKANLEAIRNGWRNSSCEMPLTPQKRRMCFQNLSVHRRHRRRTWCVSVCDVRSLKFTTWWKDASGEGVLITGSELNKRWRSRSYYTYRGFKLLVVQDKKERNPFRNRNFPKSCNGIPRLKPIMIILGWKGIF